MKIQKNIIITGSEGKPMLTDIFYEDNGNKKPVVIYAHGFNGFKDWGNFDLIAEQFAQAGFVFIKFNFSHNGTTVNEPEVFADLNAYAENNYTKELDDLGFIIDSVNDAPLPFADLIDAGKIYLLGHSMGGGIAILKAYEDKRVKALVAWASIGECKTPWGKWPEEKMQQWKNDKVAYTINSRTKQRMPLNYQLYLNFDNNKQRLNIKEAIKNLPIPVLLCHGQSDEAVPIETAFELHTANTNSQLFLVNSDHVFGRKHPWMEENLPKPMQEVLDKTFTFLQHLK